jgi:hypothetical protein
LTRAAFALDDGCVVGHGRRWVLGAGLACVAACGRTGLEGPVPGGGSDDIGEVTTLDDPSITDTTVADTSTSTGVVDCTDLDGTCPIELRLRRAVDILFVVDNSGSMGGEQGTLVQSFRSFVEVLEAQQVGANYRIGVTTTAGDGALSSIGCRDRISDFVFEWVHGTIDERQRGCLDNCIYENLALYQPWVEKSEGVTNLPDGVDLAAALQCIGPPGINGPGFERPLEAMLQVIQEDSEGFLRHDALLTVIFLTDEADCSTSDDNISLMLSTPELWTDPEQSTSGMCWTAGASCEGGPGIYDDCTATDIGWDAQPTTNPDDAVLYPLSRYTDALTALSLQRQAQGGNGQVFLSLIAGVPLDYPETGVQLYQDSVFDDFNREYGIGPACNVGTETIDDPPGIPDVRLRQVVESFAGDLPNVYSVCSADYGVALEAIAGAIGEISERSCVGGCVADISPDPGVQPSCKLVEQFPVEAGLADRVVEPCVIQDNEWSFPGPNVHACYRVLDDANQTTTTELDDMAPHCVTGGFNVELLVERREGTPIPSGTSIGVSCDLLGMPGIKCEDI